MGCLFSKPVVTIPHIPPLPAYAYEGYGYRLDCLDGLDYAESVKEWMPAPRHTGVI